MASDGLFGFLLGYRAKKSCILRWCTTMSDYGAKSKKQERFTCDKSDEPEDESDGEDGTTPGSRKSVEREVGDEWKAFESTTPLVGYPAIEVVWDWYSSKDIVEVDGKKSSSSSGFASSEGIEV